MQDCALFVLMVFNFTEIRGRLVKRRVLYIISGFSKKNFDIVIWKNGNLK